MLPSDTEVHALVCVFLLLSFLSAAVNGCTLFGLGRSEDLSWEPRFALLKSLILSDLLLTLTQAPTVLHCLLHRRTLTFDSWCLAQYFIGTVCIFCALLTITFMALERYLYVCHGIHYLRIITAVRLRLIMGLTWLLSTAIAVGNMILLHTGRGTFGKATAGLLCEPDTVERYMGFPRAAAVFRKLAGMLVTLACVLSYSFSYVRMYQEAQNAVEPFHCVNSRARHTVLFYCSMFILQLFPCWLKIISDTLWELGDAASVATTAQLESASLLIPYQALPSHIAGALHITLLALMLVPPCINPLIYGIRNREVRQALPRLCQPQRRRQTISPRGKRSWATQGNRGE
ncbi:olfactory receptor 2AG2 [Megalops cyprinoides]|uniref:olfactory receptor 2AG2 n=1 Tax=Megalops cyprinoides TaxID=118141 RepID=UPI0018654C90|nr:olfactory receptor 2AG2 [Megalops cyprinoides]